MKRLASRAPEAGVPPVTVLHTRLAYDFEFVASRLHDRHLLDSSVAVCVFRAPLLAVPVGGQRRGGCMNAGPVDVALAIRDALLEIPGFPDVRIRLVSPPYEPHDWVVEWGERLPFRITDSDRARFYGYSEAAIAACVQRPPQTPSSVMPDPCSPTAP